VLTEEVEETLNFVVHDGIVERGIPELVLLIQNLLSTLVEVNKD
jgi:hypothetical protein